LFEPVQHRLDLLAQQGPQIFAVPGFVRTENINLFCLARQKPVDSIGPLRHPDQRDVVVPAALYDVRKGFRYLVAGTITIDLLDQKRYIAYRIDQGGDLLNFLIRLQWPIDQSIRQAIMRTPKHQKLFAVLKDNAVGIFAERIEYQKPLLVRNDFVCQVAFAAAALTEDQNDFFLAHLLRINNTIIVIIVHKTIEAQIPHQKFWLIKIRIIFFSEAKTNTYQKIPCTAFLTPPIVFLFLPNYQVADYA